ncbi:MAG TPA: DUF262 domain-containing HNH endonuclease family protein [Massilibacterium sp.]|nr:DUF262 domain-containing HNH endonuclease family protein [Massilibacterium sp.]
MLKHFDRKLSAKEVYLKDLLYSNTSFYVPNYQRHFAWSIDQVEQFFDDLKEAYKKGKPSYFLGNIILINRSEDEDVKKLEIVDGQQRLMTLAIICAVMRDLHRDDEAKAVLESILYKRGNRYTAETSYDRLTIREPEAEFFSKYIMQKGGTGYPFNDEELSGPEFNIAQAMRIIRQRFVENGVIQFSFLEGFTTFLLNSCSFTLLLTGSFSFAFRLFFVLHDDGIPLVNADVIKTYLLDELEGEEKLHYRNTWNTMVDEIGREKVERLLHAVHFMYSREKSRYRLAETFAVNMKKIEEFSPQNFISLLKEFSDLYRDYFLNPQQSKGGRLLKTMYEYFPYRDWSGVVLLALKKFGEDHEQMETFIRLLEGRLVYKITTGQTEHEHSYDMGKLMETILESETLEEICEHSLLEVPKREKWIEQFVQDESYYIRSYAKYILLRIEQFLQPDVPFLKPVFIEFIMPRTLDPMEQTKSKLQEGIMMLGNLILLPQYKNHALNQLPLAEKYEKYYQTGIYQYKTTEMLQGKTEWTKEHIIERTHELSQILEKMYKR